MATFRRRGSKWRVELCHYGRRLSAYFPTKAECERWATTKQYELTHGELHPTARKTLREALQRYLEHNTPKKKSASREAKFITSILRHPICDHLLDNVTTATWAAWRDERLQSETSAKPFTLPATHRRSEFVRWQTRKSPLWRKNTYDFPILCPKSGRFLPF